MSHSLPELKSHVYWYHKKHFALERDSYPNWTLFAVETGRFSFAIGDREGIAGPGGIVFCPPRTWFYRKTVEPLSFHLIHFQWESPMDEGQLPALYTPRDKERLMSTLSYFNELSSLQQWTKESICAGKQHLLHDIWRLMLFEQARDAQLQTEPKLFAPASDDPRIQQAQQYLAAHAHEPVNMRALAEEIGMTPVQFTRAFRASYQATPLEYVTKLRLDRASRLLEETSFSIDRIAQLCGYENGFYLSRLFTRKRGMNPSAYRRSRQV